MFQNLPPRHRPTDSSGTPRQRTLVALGAALGTLPAPWRVLRDNGSPADGSSLGASFIALHPQRGIALIDLAPARPRAAVGPLRMLLSRTGKPIFTAREPPIVPILLAREEIAQAATRVEAAFAELAPCAIRDPAWPQAAIAAITNASILVTPVEHARRAGDAAERREPEIRIDLGTRPEAHREPTPPLSDRAPPRRDALRPLRAEQAPPLRQEANPRLARDEIPAPEREPRLRSYRDDHTSRARDRATHEPGERIEPTFTRRPPPRDAARLAAPRLATEPDEEWDDEPPGRAAPYRARRQGGLRQSLLWLVAASLAVIAGVVFVHPREAVQSIVPSPSPPTSLPQASLPLAQPDNSHAPSEAAKAGGSSLAETAPRAVPATPPAIAVAPRAATVLPPVAARHELEPPHRAEPNKPTDEAKATSVAKARTAPPSVPSHSEAEAKAKSQNSATRELAAKRATASAAKREAETRAEPKAARTATADTNTPDAARAKPHPVAEAEQEAPARIAPTRETKPKEAKSQTEPRSLTATRNVAAIPTPHMVPGSAAAAPSPGSQPGDRDKVATVTVDGMNYVEGREPHKLGTLSHRTTVPAAPDSAATATDQSNSAPTAVPAPGPATQFSITPSGILSPSGRLTPFGQH